MLLPKNSVPFEGLYYSIVLSLSWSVLSKWNESYKKTYGTDLFKQDVQYKVVETRHTVQPYISQT